MAGIITGKNSLVSRYQSGGSTVWPVTQVMLANHIQVTHDYDDNILYDLGGYLPAAVDEAEKRGNIALIQQNRRQTISLDLLEDLEEQEVALSVGPVISVTQVQYLDADEAEQTLSSDLYRLTKDGTVYFLDGLPTLADGPGTVWVDYVAGYGTTADSVPDAWRHIVMLLACRYYDFRGGDSGASNDSWERMMTRKIDIAGGSHRG